MRRVYFISSLLVLLLSALAVVPEGRTEPAAEQKRQPVHIKAINRAANATVYRIQLEREVLFVTESHGSREYHLLEAGSPLRAERRPQFPTATPALDAFQVAVLKDADGQITSRNIVLGEMRYFDLNGDGRIDRAYDAKSRRSSIVLEDRFVHVQNSKLPGTSAKSWDGKTAYVFKGNAWRIARFLERQ